MISRSLYRFVAALVGTAVGLTSCGGPDRIPVHPVHGKVFCQGQPAVHAYVVFHPVGGSEEVQKIRPAGRVGDDGSFSLTTYVSGDGAPAGDYQVTVGWPGPAPGTDPNSEDPEAILSGPDRLQGRYQDPKTSGLTATVTEGENEIPPFEIQ